LNTPESVLIGSGGGRLNKIEKKRFVRRMFDDIHQKYDLINTILSFGNDNRWRTMTVTDMPSGGLVIDLCGGGGQMAKQLFSSKDFVGQIVIADLSLKMIANARKTIDRKFEDRCAAVVCDVERLPFKAGIFDGAISGFSLRNLTDLPSFTGEMRRVLKRGGIARLLEIGHPPGRVFGWLFRLYFYRLAPLVARMLTTKKYAYSYLPDSLKAFPKQEQILRILSDGWNESSYLELSGGMAVIYRLAKK
jgi:demethylmenaquinone methyltransferase/2-methoxy-6-polyprenyl-1,4-benzoquinol methylase